MTLEDHEVDVQELVPVEELEPDEDLIADVQRKRLFTPLSRVLLAIAAAGACFFAGVVVERHQAGSSSATASGLPAGLANLFGQGATGRAGSGTGTTGSSSGAQSTLGTVKLVDGNNIYITDFQGNVVKVTTTPSTKVKVTTDGKPSQLRASQTVTVQGTKQADGSISATTVTQTAAGASAPTGGFPSGGFPGAGAGG